MSLITNESNTLSRFHNENSPLLPEQSHDSLEAEAEGSRGNL